MGFKIACQTISFGGKQWETFPEVFAAVKRAGFAGLETGFRHAAHYTPAEMKQMVADAGLALTGLHLGGNLEDLAQAESEQTIIDEVCEFIIPAGTTRVMYSGLKYENDEQFDAALAMLSRSAEKCQAVGARLLYHNHWYEFENDWRTMKAILEQGSTAIGFCPDMGWVHKAGADVVELLEAINGRIGAVHYKDFLTTEYEARDFCTLGQGVTPFDRVTDWLRVNLPDAWVIAEQDKSDLGPEEAVTRNAAYLTRTVLGG